MKLLVIVCCAGLLLSGQTLAQNVDSARARAEMVDAATRLLASVDGGPGPIETMAGFDRGASLAFALDDPQRLNWQYWPAERIGLAVGLMTADQRFIVHELLGSVLSSNGYLKATQIMQLDEILLNSDTAGFPRGVGHYVMAIFGTPSTSGEWAWRFEGHHVSLSVSVAPDGISVTPSFFGSNPAEVGTGPLTGLRVHGVVEDLARDLVTSLTVAERGIAVISDRAPGEILTSQVRVERDRWAAWLDAVNPEGIAVAELNEVQQHWVKRILDEVVANYRGELADQYLAEIPVSGLTFAWMGSTERRAPHYFRLQGDDFVFEYDNVQDDGNHVHSVWRSKSGDFGADILRTHYQSSAH